MAADQQTGYVRNEDMWLTQLQETGEAHVSGPLGGWFDVGLAVDEIRHLAAQLGLDADELEIGAPYVWKLTVRVATKNDGAGANNTLQPDRIGPEAS